MKIYAIIFCLICAVVLAAVAPVAAETIGGDQGWYLVHANVDGASVYFDKDFKGTITAGTLTVPVYTTGTPYKAFTVSMDGYKTFTESITMHPAKGETLDLYATLQATTPPVGPIGGDQGWYVVHANVDGAAVLFDNDFKGTITGGTLTVPVYTTGTPYKTLTISKTGYTTYAAPITQYPGKGESVDLYATLNPAPTPTPTPIPTTAKSPLEGFVVLGALIAAGCLFVGLKRTH
jgi:hypothetical protein